MKNSNRVENRVELDGMIEEITRTKTTQEWLELFEGSGMPYAAVNDIQGTLNHEHGSYHHDPLTRSLANPFYLVRSRGMVTEIDHPECGPMKLVNTPIKYSHAKPGVRTPPPTLGQHTDEVLQGLLDYSEEEVLAMKKEGVIS